MPSGRDLCARSFSSSFDGLQQYTRAGNVSIDAVGTGTLSQMVWLAFVLAAAAGASLDAEPPARPSVVLLTLDTTRADAVGAWGSPDARTPIIDRLAALGVRYQTAVSPAPLTLPAHATILTGLDPPEHGVRSNGNEVLSQSMPTLATILSGEGWNTAAFVASRVLDRRFGLDHGFSTYDDEMVAERIGEYGYPERDAEAVTTTAIDWLERNGNNTPFFLWVHYYDPHAPYIPEPGDGGRGLRADYLAEVRRVDRGILRLLRALPGDLSDTIIVVVGDHGEALGDHGEQTHGIFLYRSVIEVPLILAGPGLPAGSVVDRPVALRQLAPTLVRLVGIEVDEPAGWVELPLPGAPPSTNQSAIYAEATMPETAYGWAPLFSVQQGDLKYIEAPRPELYDLKTDPAESRNLVNDLPDEALRLGELLEEIAPDRSTTDSRPSDAVDSETRAALEQLGYLQGGDANDGIDPKDGIGLLAEIEAATATLRAGDAAAAAAQLGELVQRNPANTRLQTRYGQALLAAGDADGAVAAYQRVVESAPRSEFARRNLGNVLAALDRDREARSAYRAAIEISPRWAPPWLGLAELGSESDQKNILREAVAAGVDSVVVAWRLAELTVGDDPEAALELCELIGRLDPLAPEGAFCLGTAWLELDQPVRARPHLRRAAVLGRGTEIGTRAEATLDELQ